jgi:outer membrane protein OmpA-like peptidoglycan-associated protein
LKTIFENTGKSDEESHWLSVADLMAGLMMVFLFIAVTLMRFALVERDRVKEIAVAYQENQINIYEALNEEFSEDLTSWEAEIDQNTLTFSFNSPDILFAQGSENLKPGYKRILSNFFPRYLTTLGQYSSSIDEVRIEGHTSSAWKRATSIQDAYFKNMDLSQRRTRSVLQYVYNLEEVAQFRGWMTSHMAAVGLSSAKLRFDEFGNEDLSRSRRVSFRVVTKADLQIKKILDL